MPSGSLVQRFEYLAHYVLEGCVISREATFFSFVQMEVGGLCGLDLSQYLNMVLNFDN